jgi:outer membrane protein assembly factor BamB
MRGVPLAALVSLTVGLIAVKLGTERSRRASSSARASTNAPVSAPDAGIMRWTPSAMPSASTAPSAIAIADAGADASVDAGAGSGSDAGASADIRAIRAPARTLHGDARRLHRGAGHGPKSVHVAWTVDVGGPVAAQVTVSPDGATLYAATLEGQLVALGLGGEKKWTFALRDRAYGAPTVGADGTVWIGSDAKRLFAVKPNGALGLELELDGEVDASPLPMSDGGVVVAAGETVVRIGPRGDVGWRFRAKRKVYSAPTETSDGRIVFGSQDHRLYALGRDGVLAFSVDLGADVDCAPAALDDGSVVVGTDAGELVQVDRAGKIVFRTDVGGYVRGGVTVTRSGDFVVGTFGPVPRVVRLASDGKKLGSFDIAGTGAHDFGMWGSPLEDDDGNLYFGAQDDRLRALDARGALLFEFATKGDVDAPVTMLADGSLLLGSEDGTVTRLLRDARGGGDPRDDRRE